jgi:protein-histidine pros-kinase
VTDTPRSEAEQPSPGSKQLAWPAREAGEGTFRDLLESAPDAMVIVDPDGRILLVNAQTERHFGYPREELVGQCVELLVPERFRVGHRGHRDGYFADPRLRPMGAGLDLFARRRDGSEFPCEISLAPLETEEGRLVTAAIRDVTERRRAEEALRLQAHLLELSHDAVIVRNSKHAILSWNRGAEELYGWTEAEVVGQVLPVLLQTRFPEPLEAIEAQLLEAGRWEGELTQIRRDGADVIVESRHILLRNDRGAPIAFLAINRDITERRAAEQLQREFIAMINHDLLNPVTAIGLHAELLQATESYSPRSVANILDAARRLERLVNDLLDVSRLETGRLRISRARVDLAELVKRCAEQVAVTSQDHTIITDLETAPLPGWWDRTRLEQVCQNLLTNAVKYSPAGTAVHVRLSGDGQWARLAVRDRGVGIPEEHLPFIFDRFYRVRSQEHRAEGLGLGLYITRSLVELHGGQIAVQSRTGEGTTFTVRLPHGEPDE